MRSHEGALHGWSWPEGWSRTESAISSRQFYPRLRHGAWLCNLIIVKAKWKKERNKLLNWPFDTQFQKIAEFTPKHLTLLVVTAQFVTDSISQWQYTAIPQAWNFVLVQARPLFLCNILLEYQNVYGNIFKGHQGQDLQGNRIHGCCVIPGLWVCTTRKVSMVHKNLHVTHKKGKQLLCHFRLYKPTKPVKV